MCGHEQCKKSEVTIWDTKFCSSLGICFFWYPYWTQNVNVFTHLIIEDPYQTGVKNECGNSMFASWELPMYVENNGLVICFLFVVAALSFFCREWSDFPSSIAFKFDLSFSHYAEHFETCWSACMYRNGAWLSDVVSTLTEHILTFIVMHIVIGGEYATDRSQYEFLKN